MAEALAYMHSKDVVHRDIKPANIILDAQGRPHLTDFGVARTLGAARHTATGMTIGTAAYLSPEQVTGGELTPAVDIYALGLTLLEAMTGRREYPGSIAESALARLNRAPEIPPLPTPWPDLLARMTAIDPAERPLPEEVVDLLRGTEPVPVAPTALLPIVSEPIVSEEALTTLSNAGSGSAFLETFVAGSRRLHPKRLPLVVGGLIALIVLVGLALTASSSAGSRSKGAPASTTPPSTSQLDNDLSRLHKLVSR